MSKGVYVKIHEPIDTSEFYYLMEQLGKIAGFEFTLEVTVKVPNTNP